VPARQLTDTTTSTLTAAELSVALAGTDSAGQKIAVIKE